ncbi:hypothetical protein BS643_17900 [Pseudomonas protegens]|nr:hypothetical protein BBH58_17025 [Pseudomonas protegens]OKK41282.1 hypothetical protein BS643_17900 [Pseudomonas protegens]OKK43355.1 hypothetical protein BS644_22670 [Pseudomonas protegens]OKK55379.1 hypothetical protein BS646_29620 [Pseudomonas protegens]OKK60821.1 hypothetical protein BS645_05110 [Pseudomonas protegens]
MPDGSFGPEGIILRTRAVLVQDNNLYRATCPEGHKLVAILSNRPFELLFQSGLEALTDGYLRESVSSFAAALERLYEFSIRVQLTDANLNLNELDLMWKTVASQSERQLGMYIGMRTLKEGKQPTVLSQSESEFRNRVIHKGYFPEFKEAFKFGEVVFRLISEEVSRLDECSKDAVATQAKCHMEKAFLSLKKDDPPPITFGFGLAVTGRTDRPFSDVVLNEQTNMRRRRAGEAPPAGNVQNSDDSRVHST